MSVLKRYAVTFSVISCCYEKCGREFAITTNMLNHYKSGKNDFYCPYCKGTQGFYGKNKEDRLKDKIDMLEKEIRFSERQAANARAEERYQKNCARAQKAAKTRMKSRIKNGVCPCCNRTFKQLAAHMKSQHPEYVDK